MKNDEPESGYDQGYTKITEPGITGIDCVCPIEFHCTCGLRPALILSGDGVRSSVQQFGKDMERKLRKNDHKGGWGEASNAWLVRRMFDEVGELMEAIIAGHPAEDVIDECADVANLAHMIADNARPTDKGSWRGV